MGGNDTPEEVKDLTLTELESLESYVSLGQSAAKMLRSFGTATFILDEQGKVRLANPFYVYIDSSIAHPPDDVEPTFVNPIITNGRPQFVAKKPDGSLWAVEYRPVPQATEESDDRES